MDRQVGCYRAERLDGSRQPVRKRCCVFESLGEQRPSHTVMGQEVVGCANRTSVGPSTPSPSSTATGPPTCCGRPTRSARPATDAIGQTSHLFAQRLRPDGLALAGDPVALLRRDTGWEWPLIENPALFAADGAYLLMYFGG